MKLLKKYSTLKLIDGIMAFVCVLLTITTIVFLFHCDWLNAIMNALWAVIAWRNYQLNVRNTTAHEFIEWQENIIHDIICAIKEGSKKDTTENNTK